MEVNVTKYNDQVSIIHVDNGLNLKCELTTWGAGVYSLLFKGKRMILTHEDFKDYMYSSQFYGKTLGVVCGRLKKDGYILDKEYHLIPDSGKDFSLHGGYLNSISFKNWDYKIKESNKKVAVTFSITTRLNDNGFPGKARIYVTYEFSKIHDDIKILFKATTPSEATFVDLSNHMYFNFNDSHDISDYYLKFNANKVATTDENLLITGVKDITPILDFNKAAKLNPRLNAIEKNDFKGTIDDSFIFSSLPGKVTLKNKEVTLNIVTDYPAINIYVDNSLTPNKFINRDDFEKRRAIALEPQRFVFDKNQITLKKGEVYKNYILYKFKESK